MPWCDSCSAYHAPTALSEGNCPTCGGAVAASGEHNAETKTKMVGHSAPWHFWIVVAALGAYLIWRAISGVIWLLE
ncbi:MAG: hypothetical protein ACI81L_002161 [Verrucomicrobiales bacterium]|jgi:hypothetical protein